MFTRKSLIASLGVTPLLLASVGCVGNADAFAKKAAKFSCIQQEECSDDFNYDSQSDCRDEIEDLLKDSNAAAEDLGCEYVAKEGRACIKEARKNKKECDESALMDAADACADVWDCPEPDLPGLERDEDQPELDVYAPDAEDVLPESMMLDVLIGR